MVRSGPSISIRITLFAAAVVVAAISTCWVRGLTGSDGVDILWYHEQTGYDTACLCVESSAGEISIIGGRLLRISPPLTASGQAHCRMTHTRKVKRNEALASVNRSGSASWARFGFVIELSEVRSCFQRPESPRLAGNWLGPIPYDERHRPNTIRERGFRLVAPLWALLLAAVTPVLVVAAKSMRRQIRVRTGKCPKCGYDLQASPTRCPECGNANPAGPKQIGRDGSEYKGTAAEPVYFWPATSKRRGN